MACNILVWNIGSTSFKFKLYEMKRERLVASGKITNIFKEDSPYRFKAEALVKTGCLNTTAGYQPCIAEILVFLDEVLEHGISDIQAFGFKTVMAGAVDSPCILDEKVLAQMERYYFVAPAHNGPYMEAVSILQKLAPQIPLIGSFETSFHQTIPEYAAIYPVDKEMAEKYGLRKYGFHGAAHSYVAWKYAQLEPECKKIISIHLGGSSSICAIKDGASADTSMGFSPQSGLPMNNRNGDIDVFAVLYLMEQEGWTALQTREYLSKKCGLLGMSCISNDMQVIVDDPEGDVVVEAYTYAAAKYICSFLPALGGLDLISFSGGIGENSAVIKEKICSWLALLGVQIDVEKCKHASEASEPVLISARASKVKVYVTPVDEELMVARNVRLLLQQRQEMRETAQGCEGHSCTEEEVYV